MFQLDKNFDAESEWYLHGKTKILGRIFGVFRRVFMFEKKSYRVSQLQIEIFLKKKPFLMEGGWGGGCHLKTHSYPSDRNSRKGEKFVSEIF